MRLDPWQRPVDYDMHPREANTVSLRIVRGIITRKQSHLTGTATSRSASRPQSSFRTARWSSRRRAAQGYQALGFLDDDDATADGGATGAGAAAPAWLPAAAFTRGGGTHRVHDERRIASPGEGTGR